MAERSAFGGGDQRYLRDVQYATTGKLDARSFLHRTYATSPVPVPLFEARLIDWPADAVVLECGCGPGSFWSNPGAAPDNISRAHRPVTGNGRHRDGRRHRERVRASGGQECDVQQLPFDDESFDIVVANHMLYHVPDPDAAIAELARVVRADGVVLAATNGYGHMREINDALAEVFGDHGEGLYEVFGIESGEARLRESFASTVWHAFDNDLVVDDPAPVVDYGLSFPPGETATAAERSAFAAAVRRRFVDGHLRIRTRAGAFVCRAPRRRER